MKRILALTLLVIQLLWVSAQHSDHAGHQEKLTTVQGHVYYQSEGEVTPLPNIKVFWKEMPTMQTRTNADGEFTLNYHDGLKTLIAEKEGFESEEYTYEGNNKDIAIYLLFREEAEGESLSAVEVRARLQSLAVDANSAMLEYNISDKELLKAACCNLSESFETNPSVDVSYNDAVTGTKEILLLGLNQRYTAYSKDNINDIRGLATYDGLEFFPGRWIQSMQLAKGSPSATTSYEGMTGMINTNLYKFDEKPTTQINFYINRNARAEGNVVSTQILSDKWSNATFLHGSSRYAKIDQNNDGFLDVPLSTQLNLANVLRYNDLEGKGWNSFIGFQLMDYEKTGGQKEYVSQRDRLTHQYYGVENDTKRLALWNKVGKLLNKKGSSVGFLQQYTYHDQGQTFGTIPYNGIEKTYEAKLLYDQLLGNSNHKITLGSSFLYDDFQEEYNFKEYNRTERNVGLFGEYQFSNLEKLKILLGARVDFHNLAGTQFSPKIHIKYSPFKNSDLRLSAGRSFRTANIFEENQKYRVSQRTFIIDSSQSGEIYGLNPEEAWNYGISWVQGFRLFTRKSSLTVDFFRTDFQNQVVADVYSNPQTVQFYNIKNGSHYNSFQTLLTTSIMNGLDLRLAYKYYDTKIDYVNEMKAAPFVAKQRGFVNLGYESPEKEGKKWSFDTTLQFVGKMSLPYTKSNPVEYQRPDYSKSFMTMNGQIARDFSEHFRLYLGAENITGYTQKNPIIEAENPFGEYFDASMVYAPITSINLYLGLDVKF